MKVIFGIFAHPDDEAFGPSGTLLNEVRNGADVHLVSLTCGQAGQNPDNHPDLGAVREKEWQEAGELIGAASMRHLKYKDGGLNNESMIEIAELLQSIGREQLSKMGQNDTLEFMSSDLNGISGHIDHIVAARATCLAFYRLKQSDPRVTRLRLACVPRSRLPSINTDWIFMEAGRTAEEIGETVDNRADRERIIAIMRCHRTQREDFEHHMKDRGDTIGLDHFIVLT